MKLVKAFNIEWDTDGEYIDLPTVAFFNVDNDFDCEEELTNLLSDQYNYCVNYAEYEIVSRTREQSILVS